VSDWVGDAINGCNPVTVTVTRYAVPVVVNGRRQALVVDSAFPIVASIQPLSGQDLKWLPEGLRTERTKKIYTQTELYTVEASASTVPDRLSYRGVDYLVNRKFDWEDTGDYFKFVITAVDR
jgi:hypothetical protein